MEAGQQFCLRWNNYQSTLQHVFHKLWVSGTFVDVSLVVEGRRLDCHKVVLSACSSYFELILRDHSSHPHPLILLHDLPYAAVEALVTFMYRGEVNVSQEQLAALLRVAETLRVKGLTDPAAFGSFTKRQILEQCIPLLEHAPVATPPNPVVNSTPTPPPPAPPVTIPTTVAAPPRMPTTKGTINMARAVIKHLPVGTMKRVEAPPCTSPGPQRKRHRPEERTSPMPPTPPASLNDTPPSEVSQPSPVLPAATPEICKQEAADETDGELQIDESAGQSPVESAECDTNSTGPEVDTEVEDEEVPVPNKPEPQNDIKPYSQQLLQNPVDPVSVKERSGTIGGKSCERTYTHLDLEEGIEAVLLGRLTPAKAIAQYRIPRRTFFRRLSAVRKSRGIPSAKENAADHFLTAAAAPKDQNTPLTVPVSDSESYAASFKIKSEKQLLVDTKESKVRYKKGEGVMAPNNSYFSLLNLANNYDAYLSYLKLVSQQGDNANTEEVLEALKKGHVREIKQTVDDNRNMATEVSEAALALVANNVTAE